MITHPDSLTDLANIRHRELQAECARYRLSAQAVSIRRSESHLVARTRVALASLTSGLRIPLPGLREVEKLFDVFARINHVEPL
jgi:hypothetical protein